MGLFDIIHVEDSLVVRNRLEEIFQSKGLTTYGIGCLEELKTALEEGHRARLYITDGNFPEKEGSVASNLAEKAIIEIRKADFQSPIALFSSEYSAKIIAEKHGTLYFSKAYPLQLVEYVNRELLPKPK